MRVALCSAARISGLGAFPGIAITEFEAFVDRAYGRRGRRVSALSTVHEFCFFCAKIASTHAVEYTVVFMVSHSLSPFLGWPYIV